MSDEPISPAERARMGGTARMAKLSAEELSALGTRASDARWAAHRAELEASGKRPRAANPSMSPEVIAYWKRIVREEQPDRVWTSAMQLKRAAIARAKRESARAKRRGDGS